MNLYTVVGYQDGDVRMVVAVLSGHHEAYGNGDEFPTFVEHVEAPSADEAERLIHGTTDTGETADDPWASLLDPDEDMGR
jgi:hypothetical protein